MTHKLELSEEAIDKASLNGSSELKTRTRPSARGKRRHLLQPGFDPAGVDPEGKRIALCYKLLLLAEKLGQLKIGQGPMICRLRTDLSLSERVRYLAIARQFRNVYVWEDSAARGLTGEGVEGPSSRRGHFSTR